jgi:hypothetical protein
MSKRPDISAMMGSFVENEVYWYFKIHFWIDSDHTGVIVVESVLCYFDISREIQFAREMQPLHQIGMQFCPLFNRWHGLSPL